MDGPASIGIGLENMVLFKDEILEDITKKQCCSINTSYRGKIKIRRRFLKKKRRSESCENTSRTAVRIDSFSLRNRRYLDLLRSMEKIKNHHETLI
jgi:hypothetical protein